ncbi:MAG TPA: nucleotide disphospho-sugar-binding domain-containing protein [Trebonia sp.]
MSRFLFVVPPLTGHVNPTVAVGAELTARGHQVAWAGHPGTLEPLLADGARIFPVLDDTLTARLADNREHWMGLRGAAALKFFWEDFVIPLARVMLPPTAEAIARFAPDVVIADQQALAGAVAARRAGTAWATSATTPGELTGSLAAAMPKVEEWVTGLLTAFQRDSGVTDPVDLRFSDQLVLAYTTPALFGDTTGFGGQYVFTGPALASRQERTSFPWKWLDPGRARVLVSLGTINGPAGVRFFGTVVDALADLGSELQAVVAAPPPDRPVPPHILFAGHVPQLALLPRMSAVVSHGGHNTVCESLAHGLPLVVTPIRDDQPLVAQQVADAGAGIRLRFGRLRASELRDAVRAVLGEPRYRTAAQRVRDCFAAAGGAATAADCLEKLL